MKVRNYVCLLRKGLHESEHRKEWSRIMYKCKEVPPAEGREASWESLRLPEDKSKLQVQFATDLVHWTLVLQKFSINNNNNINKPN